MTWTLFVLYKNHVTKKLFIYFDNILQVGNNLANMVFHLALFFEKTKQDLPMKYVSINYDVRILRPIYRNVTINQSATLKVKYVFQ